MSFRHLSVWIVVLGACSGRAEGTRLVPAAARPTTAPVTSTDVAPIVPAPTVAPTTPSPTPASLVAVAITSSGPPSAVHVLLRAHGPDVQHLGARTRRFFGANEHALAGAAPDGRAVRVYGEYAWCDGRLGTPVALAPADAAGNDVGPAVVAAAVEGCDLVLSKPSVAVIDPPPASTQFARSSEQTTFADALRAAQDAASRAAHAGPDADWDLATLWKSGSAVYAMQQGPACSQDGWCAGAAAVGIARASAVDGMAGATPTVVLARPAHFPWDQPGDPHFRFVAVVDVDGDGVVEVLEEASSDAGEMLRLVRVGAHLPGDIVWRASCAAADVPLGLAASPHPLSPVE